MSNAFRLFFITEVGPCDFQGQRVDPQDCHAYLQCSDGRLYRYECGRQAAFDPATLTCVTPLPEHLNCGARGFEEIEKGRKATGEGSTLWSILMI